MIEVRPLIGRHRNPDGSVVKVAIDMDQLFMNGKFLATINRVKGCPINIMQHAGLLSESQLGEISEAVAAAREGVPPAWVRCSAANPKWKVVEDADDDDNEGDDTETDLSDE